MFVFPGTADFVLRFSQALMSHSYGSKHITIEALQEILATYSQHIPEKVRELDELRLSEIPKTIKRRKESGHAYLNIQELQTLVEWKLKHGTFRPRLLQLAKSNGEQAVRDTTSQGFKNYEDSADPSKAMKVLTELKGIGPATASLLLSTYDPDTVPFFSDELYRYVHWEPTELGGWSRKIGYTAKEYAALNLHVAEMRKRLEDESGKDVSAIDIEKIAYVLGREEQDLTVVAAKDGADFGAQAAGPAKAESSMRTRAKRKPELPATDGAASGAGAASEDSRGSKLRKMGEKGDPSRGSRTI